MKREPYPPAEDTWQTINAIRWLVMRLNNDFLMIDVGTGTGVLIITGINEALSFGHKPYGIAIDIDLNALYNARLNIVKENLYEYIDLINCDALSCLKLGLRSIIISNPPYLPGNWHEDWRIFGGKEGRDVIDKMISYACANPIIFFVITQSSLSNWELTAIRLSKCGYKLIFLMRNHYFFEDIVTMIFNKINPSVQLLD